MENKIEIFKNEELGEVRSLIIGGEPWFVGKDVAEVLGYQEPLKAIRDHIFEDEKGVTKMDTPGGKQDMIIINESGLYNLIFSSKLEKAQNFRKWVTHDVLPSIRKHGMYITEELLKDKERLEYELGEIHNKYYELENKNNELESNVKSLEDEKEVFGKMQVEYLRQQNSLRRLSIKTREEVSYLPRLTLELVRMYIKENPSVIINERDGRLILKSKPLFKELRKLILCNDKGNRNIYEVLYTMNFYIDDSIVAIPVEYLDDNYTPMFEMYMLEH